MCILAIIPARGGSKGIPQKNIRLLAGKPLISYTIQTAFSSTSLNFIFVSTDDPEIANIARSEQVEVIDRPSNISGDASPTIDAIFHVLSKCEINGIYAKTVIVLQPTSPFRTTEDIESALHLFQQNQSDSVISVVPVDHPPYWNMVIEGSNLKPIFGFDLLNKRRQEFPQAYMPNGAIYIASVNYLRKTRSFFGEKMTPYIMPEERSIDIDSEMDLLYAEFIIKNQRIMNEIDSNR